MVPARELQKESERDEFTEDVREEVHPQPATVTRNLEPGTWNSLRERISLALLPFSSRFNAKLLSLNPQALIFYPKPLTLNPKP